MSRKSGFHHSEETKRKISEGNRGKKRSSEVRQKMSEVQRGRLHSEETKRKIGEANRGRKHTSEARAKISAAKMGDKNPNWGKKLSLETRRKMSEARKGKWRGEKNPNWGKRGEEAPNWKGGRICHADGYVMIWRPDHPNAGVSGYILEHRLIVSECLDRPLKPGEMVHHINGIRDDNRIENLELVDQHRRRVCPNCGWPMKIPKSENTLKEIHHA